MPWWGWLIAGCVGAVLLTYLIVWVVVLRAVRAAMSEDERMGRRWPNRPDGWR